MSFAIATNGHTRDLVAAHELDSSERAGFDYIEGDDAYSPRLFRYRGSWYDVNEFEVLDQLGGEKLVGWSAVQTQSAFDAVLISYSDDCESVVVGYAHW